MKHEALKTTERRDSFDYFKHQNNINAVSSTGCLVFFKERRMNTDKLINEIIAMTCDEHCNVTFESGENCSKCGIAYAIEAIEEKAERESNAESEN